MPPSRGTCSTTQWSLCRDRSLLCQLRRHPRRQASHPVGIARTHSARRQGAVRRLLREGAIGDLPPQSYELRAAAGEAACPGHTRLSNHTRSGPRVVRGRQQTPPVNRSNVRIRKRKRGVRPQPRGVSSHPRGTALPTGENARRAKTCGMWRIPARRAAGAAVKKSGLGVGAGRYWLPTLDDFRTFLGLRPVFDLQFLDPLERLVMGD